VQSSLRGRALLGRLAIAERGSSTSEFVILLVCIAVAGVAAWRFMGEVVLSIISGEGR
jgi:hypothetical protein